MEFAKYYNVTNIVKKMQEAKEIDTYPTGNDMFLGVYICKDLNDFWISRIREEYKEDLEMVKSNYVVEINKIDLYHVMDKLHDLYRERLPIFHLNDMDFEQRNKTHNYLKRFSELQIIKTIILLDNEDGLSNWDCCEVNSVEEAVEIIDSGYGILEVVV